MDIIAHLLLVSAAPLAVGIVMACNARRLNAQWRERRDARRAGGRTAGSVAGAVAGAERA